MDSLSLAHQDYFDLWHELANPPMNATAHATKTRSYKYCDLEGLLKAIKPTLATYNFALSQQSMEGRDHEVKIKTCLYHRQHGPYMAAVKTMSVQTGGQDANKYSQAYGIVTTYCRRYGILELLCLVGDSDTDADTAPTGYHQVQAPPQQSQPPTTINLSNQAHVDKIKAYLESQDALKYLSEVAAKANGRRSSQLPKILEEVRNAQ